MPIIFWYHGSIFKVPLMTNWLQQGLIVPIAIIIGMLKKIKIKKRFWWCNPSRFILKDRLPKLKATKNTWLQISNDRRKCKHHHFSNSNSFCFKEQYRKALGEIRILKFFATKEFVKLKEISNVWLQCKWCKSSFTIFFGFFLKNSSVKLFAPPDLCMYDSTYCTNQFYFSTPLF